MHDAFGSSPEEIEEAKVAARANLVAAEDGYYATAEMIEAGWNPHTEQADAFRVRTGCGSSRWPILPTENPEIQWPAKLKRAA